MFDRKSDGTGALLFALLMLLVAVVSFNIAIICGGIYSTVSSLWNFANKKFTKGVLWAGPALLVGNAESIVPRLIPGARSQAFVPSQTTLVMQDQMSFLIKSFFFFLIGLMFPTNPRQIALAVVAALFLLLFRIPAVLLATKGMAPSRKEFGTAIGSAFG